jgi:hypothetical protein
MALQPFVGPCPLFRFLNPIHNLQESLDGGSAQTQTSVFRVGFEPTNPAFERAKTVHALDRAATVIDGHRICWLEIHKIDDRTVSQLLVWLLNPWLTTYKELNPGRLTACILILPEQCNRFLSHGLSFLKNHKPCQPRHILFIKVVDKMSISFM